MKVLLSGFELRPWASRRGCSQYYGVLKGEGGFKEGIQPKVPKCPPPPPVS